MEELGVNLRLEITQNVIFSFVYSESLILTKLYDKATGKNMISKLLSCVIKCCESLWNASNGAHFTSRESLLISRRTPHFSPVALSPYQFRNTAKKVQHNLNAGLSKNRNLARFFLFLKKRGKFPHHSYSSSRIICGNKAFRRARPYFWSTRGSERERARKNFNFCRTPNSFGGERPKNGRFCAFCFFLAPPPCTI